MSKKNHVEVQKGSINMDCQYTQKFHREPEHTMEDLINNHMRQEKMILTLHTPKQ
jgi:hypothetical protein